MKTKVGNIRPNFPQFYDTLPKGKLYYDLFYLHCVKVLLQN